MLGNALIVPYRDLGVNYSASILSYGKEFRVDAKNVTCKGGRSRGRQVGVPGGVRVVPAAPRHICARRIHHPLKPRMSVGWSSTAQEKFMGFLILDMWSG